MDFLSKKKNLKVLVEVNCIRFWGNFVVINIYIYLGLEGNMIYYENRIL